MYSVYPIDILHVNDNYVWAITPRNSQQAYVVDPGAAAPVIQWLEERNLDLAGILITHRHWDHVDGISELLDWRKVPVWGPRMTSVPHITDIVEHGDTISVSGISFQVMAIPGHTADHIAYYCAGAPGGGSHPDCDGHPEPALFCGDTLFAAGCGRVFDGSFEDLYLSLRQLAQLPENTAIYCAHEYTQANLKFARAVEPGNTAIARRLVEVEALRGEKLPSLPSELALELATNPFLRTGTAEVVRSAEKHAGRPLPTEQDVFTALRRWKDRF